MSQLLAMQELEKQIEDGEKWLVENKDKPSYQRGLERYWQRVDQWCQMDMERRRLVCWLQLPPGVRWAKAPGCKPVDTIGVVLRGLPHGDREMGLDDLSALLATVDEVPAKYRGEAS